MKYYGYVRVGKNKLKQFKRYGAIFDTLRIECYFSDLSIESDRYKIYAENISGETESHHLSNVIKIIDSVKDSVLVILNLSEFSTDENATTDLYKRCWDNNVDLRILESPWLDIGFLKGYDISIDGASAMIDKMYFYERHKQDNVDEAKKVFQSYKSVTLDHNKGKKLNTKKSKQVKPLIVEKSKSFNGKLDDMSLMKELGLSRNTFYKYKKEIKQKLVEGKK